MKNESRSLIAVLLGAFSLAAIMIGFYIFKFKDFPISHTPADWGVLGDYVGGVLNPLISSVTLYLLYKTYQAQKDELHKSESTSQQQLNIASDTARIQVLQTKIAASYQLLSLYQQEIDRVTVAMNANRNFIAMDGKEYKDDTAQKEYRKKMGIHTFTELGRVKDFLDEVGFEQNEKSK